MDGSYRCSFCGKRCDKRLGRVKKLIAGPGVYICDRCVGLCNAVLDKERTPDSSDCGYGRVGLLGARYWPRSWLRVWSL